MSLARLRRSSRFVAALLLLVSAFGLPHRSAGDDDCVPFGIEEHDESKHVFKAVASAGGEDHCAICHWTRWLKPVFSTRAVVTPVSDAGAELTASAFFVRRDPLEDHLPPRAPPAAAPDIARLAQLS